MDYPGCQPPPSSKTAPTKRKVRTVGRGGGGGGGGGTAVGQAGAKAGQAGG